MHVQNSRFFVSSFHPRREKILSWPNLSQRFWKFKKQRPFELQIIDALNCPNVVDIILTYSKLINDFGASFSSFFSPVEINIHSPFELFILKKKIKIKKNGINGILCRYNFQLCKFSFIFIKCCYNFKTMFLFALNFHVYLTSAPRSLNFPFIVVMR